MALPALEKEGPPVPKKKTRVPHRDEHQDLGDDGWTESMLEVEEQPVPSTAKSEHFADAPDVTISPGVAMKGQLSFPKLLRVEGSFSGSLDCGGDIVVASGGVLESDVHNDRGYLLIEGKLIGNVQARRVQIAKSGHLFGDVICNSFIIAPGAVIIGTAQVRPEPPEKNLG